MQGSEESPQQADESDRNGTQRSQPHVAPQLADEDPPSKRRKPCSDTPPGGLISRPATRSTSCKTRRACEKLNQARSEGALAAQPPKSMRTAGNAAAKRRCSGEPSHAQLPRNAEPCDCPASSEAHPTDAVADKRQSSGEERAVIESQEVTSFSGLNQPVNGSWEQLSGRTKTAPAQLSPVGFLEGIIHVSLNVHLSTLSNQSRSCVEGH